MHLFISSQTLCNHMPLMQSPHIEMHSYALSYIMCVFLATRMCNTNVTLLLSLKIENNIELNKDTAANYQQLRQLPTWVCKCECELVSAKSFQSTRSCYLSYVMWWWLCVLRYCICPGPKEILVFFSLPQRCCRLLEPCQQLITNNT